MKSPFPGMDPYVEPNWLDVHTSLATGARDALNQRLPDDLVARVEERVAVDSDQDDFRLIGPDVRVFSPSSADPTEGEGGVAIEAPFKLVVEHDPVIERFIRVIDEAGQLVTVIEFVSPSNKRQPGLDAYREKRDDLLAAGVHVVEVDLVRAGNWHALMRPQLCPVQGVALYRVTIRTSGRRRGAYLFPIRLRDPLPEIPIPLRPTDPPVRLSLQALFESAYANGRYARTIDYTRLLDPPLQGEDSAWADELLKTAGRR